MLATALRFAARLLWPARCAACAALVGEGWGFCFPCAATLERSADPCAAVVYGGAIVPALLGLKHGRREHLVRPLAALLAPALEPLLPGVDALLPVPLHPRRLRARGFNQSLALARAAARLLPDAPPVCLDDLRRVRDTPPLGRESPEARRRIVEGAFAVPRPDRIRGRRLLLIDDVMTSGATLNACGAALREAGAREVRTCVLARAL